MKASRYFAALDLGSTQDFTALAIVECYRDPGESRLRMPAMHYAVRHLERFAPGTPYDDIAQTLVSLYASPELQETPLALDITAVGRPVYQALRRSGIQARPLRPLVISGAHQSQRGEQGSWLVARKELVSTMQLLLQSNRLKVASALREADLLLQELRQFKTHPVLANQEVETWRERDHDDLVLAVALACWWAERAHDLASRLSFTVGARLECIV